MPGNAVVQCLTACCSPQFSMAPAEKSGMACRREQPQADARHSQRMFSRCNRRGSGKANGRPAWPAGPPSSHHPASPRGRAWEAGSARPGRLRRREGWRRRHPQHTAGCSPCTPHSTQHTRGQRVGITRPQTWRLLGAHKGWQRLGSAAGCAMRGQKLPSSREAGTAPAPVWRAPHADVDGTAGARLHHTAGAGELADDEAD